MHIPVLLDECINLLSPEHNSVYLDATFGYGGYTKAILNSNDSCKVIAIDRDNNVEKEAIKLQEEFGKDRFKFHNICFSNLDSVINELVNGIVFDVGVSSMQLDDPNRGFSFYDDGPLLMTMGLNDITAFDIVNTFHEKDIKDIIFKYGDERYASKIAKEICIARKNKTITSTLQLTRIILDAINKWSGSTHPATRTFQALRIAVNDELNELKTSLNKAVDFLALNGVLVVITFHSLEDRIVKHLFKELCNKSKKHFSCLTKKVLVPTISEINNNIRARSAKLRAIKKIYV